MKIGFDVKPKVVDLTPALAYRQFSRPTKPRLGLIGTLVASNLILITVVGSLGALVWTTTKLSVLATEFYYEQREQWASEQRLKEQELQARNLEVARMAAFQTSSPGDVVRLAQKISTVLNTSYGEKRTFLEKAVPHAIHIQVQYGIPASAVLSMAIYESAYGTSKLAKEHNNFFGMKALGSWDGMVAANMSTKDSGVKTTANFRAYKDILEGFKGYVEFLHASKRYEDAFSKRSGVDFVRTILAAGYCPDRDYLEQIRTIMARHHLDELDDIIDEGKMAPYQQTWTAGAPAPSTVALAGEGS
jgi:flagellum-specific peptidoglycan hydrolase FlgJ